jgi:hypothetical protein
MVWGIGDSSGGGVIVMGMVDITALHALGRGEPELSPRLRPNRPRWVIPRGWHATTVTCYGTCP